MKNIILAAILPFSFISTPAFADFNGHWVGSGQLSGVLGKKSCSKIEITMTQISNKLTTEKYSATCELYSSDWGPDHMEIQGEKVIDQGEEIGTLKGDTLMTLQSEEGVAYAFNLKLIKDDSGAAALESYYGVRNGVGALVIEGTLHQAQ